MRARLPWILFFISLALNLSVVAGVLYVGHDKIFGKPRGEQLAEQVADELDFNEQQLQALLALGKEVQAQRQAMEQETGRLTDVLVEALDADSYDPEAMRWVMIERSQPFREYWIAFVGNLHAFVRQLDEKQRAAFLARITGDRDFLRDLFPRDRR